MFYLSGVHGYDPNFESIECRSTAYTHQLTDVKARTGQIYSNLYLKGLKGESGTESGKIKNLVDSLLLKPEILNLDGDNREFIFF